MRKSVFLFKGRVNNLFDFLGRESSFFVVGIVILLISIFMFLNFEKNIFLSISLGSLYLIVSILLFLPLASTFTRLPSEKIDVTKIDYNISTLLEAKLRDFFLEGKYDEFKLLCIQNKLIKSDDLEWQREPTHFVVLYHKLKQNNYLKVSKTYTQKEFVSLAKKMFKIDRLDSSLMSHYKPGKPSYFSGGYEEFYLNSLSFIGNV